jgi:hypothetical protein
MHLGHKEEFCITKPSLANINELPRWMKKIL